jgi:hypothetical protein
MTMGLDREGDSGKVKEEESGVFGQLVIGSFGSVAEPNDQ